MRVIKRGNTYQYDFYHNGKRYRKGGYLTRREAKIQMSLKLNDLVDGYNSGEDMPFVEFYKQWLKVTKEGVINEVTYNRYVTAINIFDECFGNIRISEMDILSYRRFLKMYGEGHYYNNGILKPRTSNTVRKMHNCYKQAFECAVENGLIKRNPTLNAQPIGKKPSQTEDKKYLNEKQLKLLIKYVKNNISLSNLCLYILIITGSRFKPVQYLKYDCLNYETNSIYLDDKKNNYSPRWVKVREEDMNYIKFCLEKLPNNRNGFIFHNRTNWLSSKSVNDVLKRFCLKYQFSVFTIRALRHTHCSYLLANGMSIQYISKRLGHADINTTYRVYSHLIEEYKDIEESALVTVLDKLNN